VYYKGRHDPIVTRELFERAASVLHCKQRPRTQKREFAFRGLLRCGNCGCAITAEIQKSRYVYYRCTRSRGNCSEQPVREESLAQSLGEPLKRLRVTSERLDWILRSLKESHEDEKHFHRQEVGRLKASHEELETKINKLYEDKLADVVPAEFFKRKYREFVSRQEKLREEIEEHNRANENYLEDGARILELAKNAYSLYVTQNSFEQRKLLDLLLSNCYLEGGQVRGKLKKLFATLADGAEEEERMIAANAPKTAINKIWLPG